MPRSEAMDVAKEVRGRGVTLLCAALNPQPVRDLRSYSGRHSPRDHKPVVVPTLGRRRPRADGGGSGGATRHSLHLMSTR